MGNLCYFNLYKLNTYLFQTQNLVRMKFGLRSFNVYGIMLGHSIYIMY